MITICLPKFLWGHKNPIFVQIIVLFAGINDIIHGWTKIVIFSKACKEHYSLLSTFLWIIKEDNSCVFTADEQLGALKENI